MNRIVLFVPFMLLLVATGTSATVTSANIQIDQQISPDATELTVATRHDSTIYQKYAAYFADSELGASVGITNPDQIDFVAPSSYDAIVRSITNEQIGAAVAWGGGPTIFNNLATDGHLRTINDPSLVDWISANVSDTIAGAEMKYYDDSDNLKWVAAAISSFGFTVNNKTLEERGLPFPTSWEDLASPEFFTTISENNIAMGNAPDTTSNTRIYQIILQNFGWNDGWEMIYRMAGNSKIYGGSVETRAAVERGETAVAMTIDFYGVISMGVNPDTQYVIPAGSSIVNGDPIAITSAASGSELEAARAFTKYVLSEEGQALWTDNRINRLPVRQEAFATARDLASSDNFISESQISLIENLYNQTLENEGIAFDEDLALSLEEAMRYHFESTITSVHTNLRDTWGVLANNYNQGQFNQSRFDALVDRFGEPLITQQEAQNINEQIITDVNFRLEKQSEWESEANSKYKTIVNSLTDTVDDSVRDVPFNMMFVAFAFIATYSLIKFFRKDKKI